MTAIDMICNAVIRFDLVIAYFERSQICMWNKLEICDDTYAKALFDGFPHPLATLDLEDRLDRQSFRRKARFEGAASG